MSEKIFKIQIDMTGQSVLTYDKDEEYLGEFGVTDLIKTLMDGRTKAYFLCKPPNECGPLEIIEEVENQDW